MKKRKHIQYIVLLLPILLLFAACDNEDTAFVQTGSLIISVQSESLEADDQLLYVLVSAHNSDSSIVFADKKVSVHVTDSTYISEPIELIEGDYTIDGLGYLNYKNELLLLTPKPNTKASQITGQELPPECTISSDSEKNIHVYGYAPQELDLQPIDFGYQQYYMNSSATPVNMFSESICVQIGVKDDFELLHDVKFQLMADDSLVLSGICSGGYTSFTIPAASNSYTIASITLGGIEFKDMLANDALQFNCSQSNNAFINLLDFDTVPPNTKRDIFYLKQHILQGGFEADLSMIDENGRVFNILSNNWIKDSLKLGSFLLPKDFYGQLQDQMINGIGKVDADSVRYYHQMSDQIEQIVSNNYNEQVPPPPTMLFAIRKLPNDSYVATLIDANGPPQGVQWDKDDAFLPLKWLQSIGFYKDNIFDYGELPPPPFPDFYWEKPPKY